MDFRSGSALYESEERYQSVVAAMTEGVILQDADSVILACNQAAERLLGLTADQMMGRSSLDPSWPSWRSIHEDGSPFPGEDHPVPVTLRTGEPQRNVVMGVHKPDGSLVWLSINSEPIFREGESRPYAAVCTFRDITERKLAEDALRNSEERYRLILETSLEGVWIIDLDGKTTYCNQRMAEMLGYTREEMMRSSVWDFLPEADRDLVRQRLAARGQGIGELHDSKLRHKDGHLVWTSMATSGITMPDGSKAALAMVRDVTVERRMQSELRASKEHLELALTAGQLGTWEWILGTDHITCSTYLHDLLGLPPSEPLTSREAYYRSVHPDDREPLREKMREYVSSGSTEPFVNVYRIVRADGRVRWVRSSGRTIAMATGDRRVLGTIIDITESRAMEERLQQARQLESIGRLAGGIAHDFNNLLTAILASLTFAEAVKPAGIRDELQTIRTAAERAAELTRQLLAFARKQVIQLAPLDVNAIVRNLGGVLRRLVGEDIDLTVELADDLWTIRGGQSQIEQVIMNLVVNAREAMPDGGPLAITTRNVTLDDSSRVHPGVPAGDYVAITVTDAGIGIDEEALPHIFEPFYSTKRTGTGLGLASCYGIVQQLGGHIQAESQRGAGATFTVYLPRDREHAGHQTRTASPHPRRGNATVMLVEDDDLLRGVIARGLTGVGYRVLVAGDGEEALQLATTEEGPIDVLVTDVVMPKMAGRQLADRFTAVRPATKILFVSGYTDQIIARQGVLEPGQNLLAKPYTIESLEQRIGELLAG